MKKRCWPLLLLVLLSLYASTGCSLAGGEGAGEPARSLLEPLLHVHSSSTWSFKGPESWVSWADQVAVVFVASERDGETVVSPERPDRSGTEQVLTVEIVDTLWLADEGRAAPGTFDLRGPGFANVGDVRYRLDDEGAVFAPGGTYLVGLIDPLRDGRWELFSPHSNFEFVSGAIAYDEGSHSQDRTALEGKTAEDIRELLEDTAPIDGVDVSEVDLETRLARFRQFAEQSGAG